MKYLIAHTTINEDDCKCDNVICTIINDGYFIHIAK